jgi:hypothetical protein
MVCLYTFSSMVNKIACGCGKTQKYRNKKKSPAGTALAVLHPFAVPLLQVPADRLHVATIVADGEPLAFGLEHYDLHLMARALLAYHLFQPDPSG